MERTNIFEMISKFAEESDREEKLFTVLNRGNEKAPGICALWNSLGDLTSNKDQSDDKLKYSCISIGLCLICRKIFYYSGHCDESSGQERSGCGALA